MDSAEFDVVVVGSGFGGSVAALRLAEAGHSVCVLERGKRYPPGSFARSPRDMSKNFWDPSKGLYGLFDVWSFRGLEAIVSSGLGGGSLIYANVMIRKDEKWFVREDPRDGTYEYWPVTREDLDEHYCTAEKMLGANPYPLDKAPYRDTPKTNAVRGAAERLNVNWRLPNLAIDFGGDDPAPGRAIEGDNIHGMQRVTCRLCGECDVGCNYGAKNTLDYNYLTLADRTGAVIQDRCEVRRIEPDPSGTGYRVHYARFLPENDGVSSKNAPVETIRCRVLVISAGSLGSTYLLLSNRSAFPRLSPALGSRFCGNGDLLGFMSSNKQQTFDPSRGPVITSTMRVGDRIDGDDDPRSDGRGFYLQDGGYPQFVNWILETSTVVNPAVRAARFALAMLRGRLRGDPTSQLSSQLSNLIGDTHVSAGMLPMLGMGRDVPDGTMKLRKGWLDIDWTVETSLSYFNRVRRLMHDVAGELDADLSINPTWWLKRVITVHPLGGCPMGRDSSEGVVDDHGEVFGYPGLFVADGSVMPGPVGPNPSLTIAALSERFSRRMSERCGADV